MQILQANNAAYGSSVSLFRDTTVSRSAQHRRVLSMGCNYFASQSVEDGFDAHALRLGEDAAVVPLHAVRQAPVRRLVALIALRRISRREVRVVHCAVGRERASDPSAG